MLGIVCRCAFHAKERWVGLRMTQQRFYRDTRMRRTLVGRTRSERPTSSAGGSMDETTEKITLRLPARFLKALDFLVELDDFPSRSEAVRAAIRDLVYARVELVTEKLKKIEEAERSMAQMEAFKREFMQ